VRVRIHLKQDYAYRIIWDVIGRVRGSVYPDEWVLAGNHRDAWVYGAVDPGSGTVAMLEAVRGIGHLLKTGWRPKRTIIVGSWDAEEHGLMGSTEWAEQHSAELDHAVAYLNVDSAVSGPNFGASAVPSLKQFMRDVTRSVPSPKGGTVYEVWRATGQTAQQPDVTGSGRIPVVQLQPDVPVGDLGSGSDYTPFLQHLGIPSTDMASTGSYGVYHSAFDDFTWFKRFADPDFTYEQEMARIFGMEVLRFGDADLLPYDYENYGKEIAAYIRTAQEQAQKTFLKPPSFAAALEAAERFARAGAAISRVQAKDAAEAGGVNRALRDAERALLLPNGLPGRPWFRHAIYAPGRYAGYAAAVIPAVNEAIDGGDLQATQQHLGAGPGSYRPGEVPLDFNGAIIESSLRCSHDSDAPWARPESWSWTPPFANSSPPMSVINTWTGFGPSALQRTNARKCTLQSCGPTWKSSTAPASLPDCSSLVASPSPR
jgi:N-acetylated-alpha-linked acidic dipeptidase